MRFYYALYLLLTGALLISMLNSWLLAKMFPAWRPRRIRYTYILLTAVAIATAIGVWSPHPSFAIPKNPPYSYLFICSLAWLTGQLVLIAFQPLLYIACRLTKAKPAEARTEPGPPPSALTRRAFLHKTLAAVPLMAFGASAEIVYGTQNDLAVVRHSLALPNLPSGLDGFKLGQLSDTHLGPYFDLERLDTVLTRLVREKPDLVAITGDFIDDIMLLKPAIDRLVAFQAAIPHGVYICWGNHEYFRNFYLINTMMKQAGLKILENSSALILPGQPPFFLLGVDYPVSATGQRGIAISADKRRQNFAAANSQAPANAFKVLIAHHPDFLIDGFAARIPLTLAGHTHGGQVVLGGKSLISLHTYVRGLYRVNGVYGYVSSGAGHWFPFRVACPPEISIFTLRAQS